MQTIITASIQLVVLGIWAGTMMQSIKNLNKRISELKLDIREIRQMHMDCQNFSRY